MLEIFNPVLSYHWAQGFAFCNDTVPLFLLLKTLLYAKQERLILITAFIWCETNLTFIKSLPVPDFLQQTGKKLDSKLIIHINIFIYQLRSTMP